MLTEEKPKTSLQFFPRAGLEDHQGITLCLSAFILLFYFIFWKTWVLSQMRRESGSN